MDNKLPNPKEMLKMASEEYLRQERDTRTRKQLEEAQKRARIDREVERVINYLSEDIHAKAEAGYFEFSFPFDRDSYEDDSLYAVTNILSHQGYKVFIRYDSIDYGDSAAPCVRDRIILDVSWK